MKVLFYYYYYQLFFKKYIENETKEKQLIISIHTLYTRTLFYIFTIGWDIEINFKKWFKKITKKEKNEGSWKPQNGSLTKTKKSVRTQKTQNLISRTRASVSNVRCWKTSGLCTCFIEIKRTHWNVSCTAGNEFVYLLITEVSNPFKVNNKPGVSKPFSWKECFVPQSH